MIGEPGAVSQFRPSPNHDARAGDARPDILLLHYTGMESADAALDRLTDPAAKVSAHYVVLEDGTVVQLVAEDRRAWHAGAGSWEGRDDVNSRSIGIEIVNAGHPGGLPPYPADQVAAVAALASAICSEWGIRPERVLAHSDTAPDRKEDPGEHFPWDALAAAGCGLWPEPEPPSDTVLLAPGRTGDDVAALQAALVLHGYGLPETGLYDEATATVLRAFQRHYRPARVDGLLDASTLSSLRRVLAAQAT